ncbi:STE24 endopeptidase protein [Rutstroemia sp. NJR-2017a BBW]|nr:STE24 endopeptidase protein [Rutstroemia sp. NJR-2017a BBW]
MFPKEADPTGDPETWSREELRRWLAAVQRFAPEQQRYQGAIIGKSQSQYACIKEHIRRKYA